VGILRDVQARVPFREPARDLVRQSGSGRVAAVLAASVLFAASATPAGNPSWRITEADVRVVCPMTIGGSFEAKTRALAGTLALIAPRPPIFSGDLTVDLATLDTGIDLRNEHLRAKYLEVEKGEGFARAVLSDIHLGDVDPATFQGRTTFSGSFRLHGVTKAISGTAEIRRVGSDVRLDASFPVMLPDHGIEKPRYLGIGVKDQVQVKVTLVAAPIGAPAGEKR
jgi:polyisoprenoid-binding protein YceI